ncbi:MAG TPA: CsbD family protein [Burkholderiales bacterium]|nr:CsbD family protein [Burkholderiales bacterium]
MKKEQVTGRAEQAKGTVKEAAGKATGDKTLRVKGKAQKAAGAVKSAYGDAKDKAEKDHNA